LLGGHTIKQLQSNSFLGHHQTSARTRTEPIGFNKFPESGT